MPVNITTAVDSLVELVNNKGRISLEEAARELGLPSNIINEWATFLEEENVLEIEYQFTTPFLIAKSKKEADEKDYSRDTEIIFRNLEIITAQLNKIEIKQCKELLMMPRSNTAYNAFRTNYSFRSQAIKT